MGAGKLTASLGGKPKYDPNVLKYNEGKKQYYFTNADGVNIYLSDADASTRNPTQYKSLVPQVANNEWKNQWEPQWKQYGEGLQRELQTAYDRSLAEAQGWLGYGLSMSGSGEGGLAEASRLALQTEAQNKRMDISQRADQVLQQAYLQFMQTKDQQAFEMAKMGAQYQYAKEMAEMNEPSWWESLGGIVGMGVGLFGLPRWRTTSPYAMNGVYV